MKNKKKTNDELKCFIITPIGENLSDTRRRADGVIKSVINEVLKERGFKSENIKAAHEIPTLGSISNEIFKWINESDLVIANLTELNPNVMYELALRHCLCKPIIHICECGWKLPFDLKDHNTIIYKNDMMGVCELKESLLKLIDEIEYDKEYTDNPILNSLKNIYINEKFEEFKSSLEPGSTQTLLIEKIEDMDRKLNNRTIDYNFNKHICLENVVEKLSESSLIKEFYINDDTFNIKFDDNASLSYKIKTMNYIKKNGFKAIEIIDFPEISRTNAE
ncbi:hypothetical protein [Clostridium perfringens]|uniref:hypothetical protein n=1 Tax=Clostridium perfringens TaxID=1502 RepID=UPI0039EC6367